MHLANMEYRRHLRIVMTGQEVEARGLKFKEISGRTYTTSMNDPVVRIPERKMGYKFAAAEPHWILSGSNLLADISSYGKMAPYSDDGIFMRGAYGPKVVDQIPYICRTLYEDQGTRQAVLTIWRERPEKSKDIPCTIAMQFMIRDGFLDCFTMMRSSDSIMGLPYDATAFSLISAYILSVMHAQYGTSNTIKLGQLHLFIGSAHVYDRDYDLATQIYKSTDDAQVGEKLDFNRMARLNPQTFMDCLESAKNSDEGILELRQLR